MIAPIGTPSRNSGTPSPVREADNLLRFQSPRICVVRISQYVCNVNHSAFKYGAARDTPTVQPQRESQRVHPHLGRVAVGREVPVFRTVWTADRRRVRFAQPCGRFHERIEYRLQIERRTADDPQNFGSRRLLLQRLIEFTRFFCELVCQRG